MESEKYLVSLITKINQEFKSSLLNFSGSRLSSGNEENNPNEYEEQEIAFIMQDEDISKETNSEIQSSSVEAELPVSKVFKPNKNAESVLKLEPMKIEMVQGDEKAINFTQEIYSSTNEADKDEQQQQGDNMFSDDKEIYDIMEIEGNEDIYVDQGGSTILNCEDDDGEFILVNYKSETEDLSHEKEYIVEEDDDEQNGDEMYDEQIPKASRKKHVERMPREIVDRYAQSTESNQHICTKCVKIFSTRTNLIRHIQSHDGNKVR